MKSARLFLWLLPLATSAGAAMVGSVWIGSSPAPVAVERAGHAAAAPPASAPGGDGAVPPRVYGLPHMP